VLVHSGKRITAGYLNSISDTSVYVSPIPVAFNSYLADKSASGSISYNQIYKLKIRRKGNAGRGIIIGALAGAATGAMIGYASAGDGSWFKGSELAKTGGVVLGLTGALIGAIIGSAYKTFIVKNNKEKFDEFKRQLVQED
jgi:hypothetical protein